MSNKNNTFVVGFNSKNKTFKPNFSKKEKQLNTKVTPNANSVEEIYYDEVVIYDGGGVKGYGDD